MKWNTKWGKWVFSLVMVPKNHVLLAYKTFKKNPKHQNCQTHSFSMGLCAIGMWLTIDIRTLTLMQCSLSPFHTDDGLCELCPTHRIWFLTRQLLIAVFSAWLQGTPLKQQWGWRNSSRRPFLLLLARMLFPAILHHACGLLIFPFLTVFFHIFTAHLCSQRCQKCVAEMLSA